MNGPSWDSQPKNCNSTYLKSDGAWQALSTAKANSLAPGPPLAQWVHMIASKAPCCLARLHIFSSSAWVSVWNLLTATTTGIPNRLAFSICFLRLQKPFSTRSRFSFRYSVKERDRISIQNRLGEFNQFWARVGIDDFEMNAVRNLVKGRLLQETFRFRSM